MTVENTTDVNQSPTTTGQNLQNQQQTQTVVTPQQNNTVVQQQTQQEQMIPLSQVKVFVEEQIKHHEIQQAIKRDTELKKETVSKIEQIPELKESLIKSGIDFESVSGEVLNTFYNFWNNGNANVAKNNTVAPTGFQGSLNNQKPASFKNEFDKVNKEIFGIK